jgi:glycerophosphoryl diester phosphodiesterase
MKIIGHRGVAGLALENTLSSFELARLLGVDAVELDIHKTKDGRLVVSHDGDLERIGNARVKIADLDLKDLQNITLSDGQSRVPTLDGALRAVGDIPVIVEIKSTDCVPELIEELTEHSHRDISIASFKHDELTKLRDAGIKNPLIALERTKPFDIIQLAKHRHFDGVGLNFWLLNPLTYWMIKRAKLSLYVYTINSKTLGRSIGWLYPDVGVCTDHPEWFIKHPWLTVKRSFGQKHKV